MKQVEPAVRERPDDAAWPAHRARRPAIAAILGCIALLGASAAGAAADDGPASPTAAADSAKDVSALQFSRIAGADGVALNVVTTGNPEGPPILFVHGIGQSYLAFEPQFQSSLARRHRLIAYDLRGHGNSGKPDNREAYADTRKWADDLLAVLRGTTSRPALLVGWSYGTGVIVDYLRHHGTAGVAGIVLISADGGLSLDQPRPPSRATGPMAELLDAMHRCQEGPDLEDNVRAARELARMLTAKPMPEAWVERAALVSMRIPASVWGYLREHPVANGGLRQKVDVPVLLVIGRYDGGTNEARSRQTASDLRRGTVKIFEHSGHTPFLEEAAEFNEMLETFARSCFPTP